MDTTAEVQVYEYTARLADGTTAELVICHDEVANYSTARCGKINPTGLRYYESQLALGVMQGGLLEALHYVKADPQLATWNAGKPIQWQEIDHG